MAERARPPGMRPATASRVTDDEISAFMRAFAIAPGHRSAVARRLVAAGGVVGLWRAGAAALGPLETAVCGIQERWAATVELWGHALRAAPTARLVDGPAALLACLDPWLPLAPVETFHTVFLDGRGRFAGAEEVARGTVAACLVHPREVYAPAIRARAAALAVVHNHPSGDPEPSQADVALTDRLAAAGGVLGIPLVDHLIVGRSGHRSLGPGAPVHEWPEPGAR